MGRSSLFFFFIGATISFIYLGMMEAIVVMYPLDSQQINFQGFVNNASLVAAVFGPLLYFITPKKFWFVSLDIYGPGILLIITIVIGHLYANDTKTDEFLFYFVMVFCSMLYAILTATKLLTAALRSGSYNLVQIALCIIALIAPLILQHLSHVTWFSNGISNIYVASILALISMQIGKRLFNMTPDL